MNTSQRDNRGRKPRGDNDGVASLAKDFFAHFKGWPKDRRLELGRLFGMMPPPELQSKDEAFYQDQVLAATKKLDRLIALDATPQLADLSRYYRIALKEKLIQEPTQEVHKGVIREPVPKSNLRILLDDSEDALNVGFSEPTKFSKEMAVTRDDLLKALDSFVRLLDKSKTDVFLVNEVRYSDEEVDVVDCRPNVNDLIQSLTELLGTMQIIPRSIDENNINNAIFS